MLYNPVPVTRAPLDRCDGFSSLKASQGVTTNATSVLAMTLTGTLKAMGAM